MNSAMSFPWNDWQPRLQRLVDEGLSASEIALDLAVNANRKLSRSAVIGRLHRTGLWPLKVKIMLSETIEKAVAIAARRKRVRGKQTVKTTALALPAEPLPAPGEHVAGARPCSILELGEKRCHWPVAEWPMYQCNPLEPIYCGANKGADDGPYCKAHAQLALPEEPRRKVKHDRKEAA